MARRTGFSIAQDSTRSTGRPRTFRKHRQNQKTGRTVNDGCLFETPQENPHRSSKVQNPRRELLNRRFQAAPRHNGGNFGQFFPFVCDSRMHARPHFFGDGNRPSSAWAPLAFISRGKANAHCRCADDSPKMTLAVVCSNSRVDSPQVKTSARGRNIAQRRLTRLRADQWDSGERLWAEHIQACGS